MKAIPEGDNYQEDPGERSLAKKAGSAVLPLIVMAVGAIITVIAILNGNYVPEIPGEQLTFFQEYRLIIWALIGLVIMAIGYYVTPNNMEALKQKRNERRIRKQQKAQQKAARG